MKITTPQRICTFAVLYGLVLLSSPADAVLGFIVKAVTGGGGGGGSSSSSEDPLPTCDVTKAEGYWHYDKTMTGSSTTISYEAGSNRKIDDLTEDWLTKTKTFVKNNFKVTGKKPGSSHRNKAADLVNQAVPAQEQTFEDTFKGKGALFQYRIKLSDKCVNTWVVMTREFAITPHKNQKPCCLPGNFVDQANAHGLCKSGSPYMCSEDKKEVHECELTKARGVWKYRKTSTGTKNSGYSYTIVEESTRDEKGSKAWKDSAKDYVANEFEFKDEEVGKSFRTTAANTVKKALDKPEKMSHRTTWYEKGPIWQYEIEMGDKCDKSWVVKTMETLQTENKNKPPCCLPGHFLNKNNPHGPCKKNSPCTCSKSVCEPESESQDEKPPKGGPKGGPSQGKPSNPSRDCPTPKMGSCTSMYEPVECGDKKCKYSNACKAKLAGFSKKKCKKSGGKGKGKSGKGEGKSGKSGKPGKNKSSRSFKPDKSGKPGKGGPDKCGPNQKCAKPKSKKKSEKGSKKNKKSESESSESVESESSESESIEEEKVVQAAVPTEPQVAMDPDDMMYGGGNSGMYGDDLYSLYGDDMYGNGGMMGYGDDMYYNYDDDYSQPEEEQKSSGPLVSLNINQANINNNQGQQNPNERKLRGSS